MEEEQSHSKSESEEETAIQKGAVHILLTFTAMACPCPDFSPNCPSAKGSSEGLGKIVRLTLALVKRDSLGYSPCVVQTSLIKIIQIKVPSCDKDPLPCHVFTSLGITPSSPQPRSHPVLPLPTTNQNSKNKVISFVCNWTSLREL